MDAERSAGPDPAVVGFDGYGFYYWLGHFDLATPKRLSDFAVRGWGESAVRRLANLLEDNGYLRRDRAPLGGFGHGMGWIWTRHPEGDAQGPRTPPEETGGPGPAGRSGRQRRGTSHRPQ
ncbi:hypothetical protein [Amycolatopsis sp. NPDC004079]|uniref:hypothetical protein n=1 Tax=Amycolatopsis sp. NPDC004079 TaxID=3154549 RepID=UPI0033A30093